MIGEPEGRSGTEGPHSCIFGVLDLPAKHSGTATGCLPCFFACTFSLLSREHCLLELVSCAKSCLDVAEAQCSAIEACHAALGFLMGHV